MSKKVITTMLWRTLYALPYEDIRELAVKHGVKIEGVQRLDIQYALDKLADRAVLAADVARMVKRALTRETKNTPGGRPGANAGIEESTSD